MKKELDEIEKIRMEFQLWLAQWDDIPCANNPHHNLYLKLFNVFKFINNYIEFDVFIKNHGWKRKQWEEVDFLIRDIELTDKILLHLPPKIRRNLLANIQHFKVIDLAKHLDCVNGTVNNLFDYKLETDSKEQFVLPLARLLDAPYWFIRIGSYESSTPKYEEYNDVKSIFFNEFIKEVNIEPGNIKFFKIKRSQEYFINPKEEYIFVKVISYSKFKIIETMGLNYENEEIFDFINYGIRDEVRCIIVTPAILRKEKKVIYVLTPCLEKDSAEIISYIYEMQKRKFTRIFEYPQKLLLQKNEILNTNSPIRKPSNMQK